MPDDKFPKPSLRNPLAVLAMALDCQADEETDPVAKEAKRASARKVRELALAEPSPAVDK